MSVLASETLDVKKKFNKKEYYFMNIPPVERKRNRKWT